MELRKSSSKKLQVPKVVSKSLFIEKRKDCNLSVSPSSMLIAALGSHPKTNYRMEFLNDIMMQKYSLFELTELQEEIDDLVEYLDNRTKLVTEIIRRIQWIKPIPSKHTLHGF